MTFEYNAVIRSVHDGDSLRADVDLGFGIWVSDMALRLAGINAPELGHPGGRESRDWLRAVLPVGQAVTIRTYKDATEKYGRMLADVWDREGAYGDSVNDLIVAEGHALRWDGTGPRPEATA